LAAHPGTRLADYRARTRGFVRYIEMKKFSSLLVVPANFFLASNSFAAEILGYPVTPTQAKFYLLILGLIGVSIGMVSIAYFAFWVLDLKKKKGEVRAIAVRKEKAFAGEFAVAAHSAK
jgi:hypothetical protein